MSQTTEPKETTVILQAFKSPFTYIIAVFLSIWAVLHFGINIPILTGLSIIFAILLALMIQVDLKHMILPDSLNIILFILGVIWGAGVCGTYLSPFLGAIFGFAIFFFIFYITYKLRGEPAMGFGDVKFITALGTWIGPFGIPLMLLYASIFAGLFIIFKSVFKGKFENKPFPYGPFLAIAGWLAFLYPTVAWNVILEIRENIIGLL